MVEVSFAASSDHKMAATTRMRWGDALDEEDEGTSVSVIPAPSITGPDARGVKTYTDYKKNDKGEVIKITTRVRVTKVQKKLYKAVEERKNWARFGDALKESERDSVTAQSPDEISFERVRQQKQTQEEQKQDLQKVLQSSDKGAIVSNLRDLLYKKRMERQLAQARGEYQSDKPPEEEDVYGGGLSGLPAAGSKPGGYVPPSLKNRTAGETVDSKRREENSLRVTNLSEDTKEEDLRELFSTCGPISRIYIAYDRETKVNRGFGFVNFTYKEDANKAIQRLNGHGYDNLILHVEWAQPRAER